MRIPRSFPHARCRGLLALLAGALLSAGAHAQIDAVTADGKRVRLFDDQTWAYVDEPADAAAPGLRLEIESMRAERDHCVFGLRLHNNAAYTVVSLVPQFAAILDGGVVFDTVFVGFQSIKPTQSQYQRLIIERMACERIVQIQVLGGDRCNMDDLDRYSPADGACLRRVELVPSTLVRFVK